MILQIPFDSAVIPFMIYIGIITVCIGIFTFRLLKDLLKRKNKILLYLFLGINCWFIGSFGFFIGLISWYVNNDRTWIYNTSVPLGYTSIIIAALFFLLFSLEIFDPTSKKKRIYITIYGVYTVFLVILFFNFEKNQWGILPPIPDFRLMNLILMIVGQLILYSTLMSRVNKLRKRVKDPLFLKKLNRTFFFFLFFLTCFVMMVVSEIHLMLINNPPPFGPFEYIAWAFGLLGIYMGFNSFRSIKTDEK